MGTNEVKNGGRPTWDEYFGQIAEDTGRRASCFSEGKGAVITMNNHIVSTGYNGAPKGVKSCKYDLGFCKKNKAGFGHGEGHHVCSAVHAEANAIVSAAKIGVSIAGGTLYCTHEPCEGCAKLIINAGITTVKFIYEYPSETTKALFAEANITVEELHSLSSTNRFWLMYVSMDNKRESIPFNSYDNALRFSKSDTVVMKEILCIAKECK